MTGTKPRVHSFGAVVVAIAIPEAAGGTCEVSVRTMSKELEGPHIMRVIWTGMADTEQRSDSCVDTSHSACDDLLFAWL